MSRDHSNYSIVEISQNIKKSPGDLLSLRLQWKTISDSWFQKTQMRKIILIKENEKRFTYLALTLFRLCADVSYSYRVTEKSYDHWLSGGSPHQVFTY